MNIPYVGFLPTSIQSTAPKTYYLPPDIAGSLHNLGSVLGTLGDLEEAKKTHGACLKMRYAIYGTDKAHYDRMKGCGFVPINSTGGICRCGGE